MNKQHKRNTEAVIALARKKSEQTLDKVNQTIKTLIKNKEVINFNTVAISSGVSKSYLYNNIELRTRIDALRRQQQQVKSPKAIKYKMSDPNKDATIEMLREKNKKLESENKKLKEEIRHLLGKKYDDLNL